MHVPFGAFVHCSMTLIQLLKIQVFFSFHFSFFKCKFACCFRRLLLVDKGVYGVDRRLVTVTIFICFAPLCGITRHACQIHSSFLWLENIRIYLAVVLTTQQLNRYFHVAKNVNNSMFVHRTMAYGMPIIDHMTMRYLLSVCVKQFMRRRRKKSCFRNALIVSH